LKANLNQNQTHESLFETVQMVSVTLSDVHDHLHGLRV
jgi:hypothetical protein